MPKKYFCYYRNCIFQCSNKINMKSNHLNLMSLKIAREGIDIPCLEQVLLQENPCIYTITKIRNENVKMLFFFTGVEMDYTLHRVLPLDGEALGTNKHLCWTSYKDEFVKCFYPSFKYLVNCSRKCLTKKIAMEKIQLLKR